MSKRVGVTAAEMLTLREQGMSNHDIAKSLDISCATVYNYIGKQDGRMEGYAAFKDAPARKEKAEVKPMIPKYDPKPFKEAYEIGGIKVVLDHDERRVEFSASWVGLDSVPDLVQFLAWAMRERMEVTAYAQTDEVRESSCYPERGEV